jgi:sugar phosphate isomerase/epimerase
VFYLNPRGAQRRSIMKTLAEAGVRAIGTDGCTWDAEGDRQEIGAFLADLDEFGLSIHSMHAVPSILADAGSETPPELWAALLADLRRLSLFGGRTAVYHACLMRDVAYEKVDEAIEAVGWEPFVERNAETIRRLAREAAKSGISIVLENVWHSVHAQSVTGFMDIIDAVGEPNVGICLDSGHTHLAGLSVGDEVRAAGALLRDTHFHDNVGPANGTLFDQHIPPGLGTIDWQDVCRAFDEIAFPGPVVFEGVLGPGDSIKEGRFGGRLSHEDLIDVTIRNWRAFESFTGLAS